MLVTETVAIVAAARSPEYWLPFGAQPCKPEGTYKVAMMKNDWVGRCTRALLR